MDDYQYQRVEDEPREELGCCGCLEKWFLCTVNFILFIVGIAEMGVGVYAMQSNSSTWTGSSIAGFAIAMGALVGFIAFLGCCGAAKENRCMLWFYSFALFWIVLIQTSGLTVCAIGSSYTKEFLSTCWDNLDQADISKIEDAYDCCSFDGNSTDATPSDKVDYLNCTTENPQWTHTCWDKVHSDVQSNFKSISIAAAFVLVAQIIFLFMTMALISGITKTEAYRKINRRMSGAGPKVGI